MPLVSSSFKYVIIYDIGTTIIIINTINFFWSSVIPVIPIAIVIAADGSGGDGVIVDVVSVVLLTFLAILML